jgi:aquaporin Z
MFKEITAVANLVRAISENLQRIKKKFFAKIMGTFIVVVVSAIGSVVIYAKMNGIWGISFIAFTPFVGAAIDVYLFVR